MIKYISISRVTSARTAAVERRRRQTDVDKGVDDEGTEDKSAEFCRTLKR